MFAGQRVKVHVVANPRVRVSERDGRAGLLRQDRLDRITEHGDRRNPWSLRRQLEQLRCRGYRITEVDVQLELHARSGDAAAHADANTRVEIIVADRLCDRRVGKERHAVFWVQLDTGHVYDARDDRLLVVGVPGEQIRVGGRLSGIEHREEHASLQHEVTRVRGGRQTSEPPLQHVQRLQFLGRTPLTACPVLQVQVGAATGRGLGRPAHSAITASTAARTGPKTPSSRANASTWPGRAPRRSRYRRSADSASGSPSLPLNLMRSTTVLSAS